MPVAPGRNLLHYRIVDKLGEGGMGTVWRAVDTTLDREVAIKILPEPFAADAERVARFDREAKTLAALNHPSIAAVHSVHEHDGVRFIAQELVPGEDLSAVLARGPLERDDALRIAVQIAEGLDAAHERGIVHRDLKPANVRLEPAGRAKILDFGLAKALGPLEGGAGSAGTSSLSLSPTMTSVGTMAGTLLGTAGYMSPEQARGKSTDRRSDMWAFGCVLYEMLTGRRPFAGETASDTLAAILKVEPDWSALPAEVPAPIQRLLRRCLTKDVARRQAGAADARILIEEVLTGSYTEADVGEPAPSRLPWFVAGAMALLAAILGWVAFNDSTPGPARAGHRLSIAFPEGNSLVYSMVAETFRALDFAPGGSRLTYVGEGETSDATRLHVRDLTAFEPVPLDGTSGARYPTFSPDGEWIVYFRGNQLEKIPAVGGASVPLADVQQNRGLSWQHPDRILYVPNLTGGIWSVDPRGGEPVQITRPDTSQKIVSHRFPHMLPDGEHLLVTGKTSTLASFDDALIMVASLTTGEVRTVLRGGMDARYHDGHLVYGRDGNLLAVPFDLDRLETTGTPVPIVSGVITSPVWGCAQYALLADGTIAYVPGDGEGSGAELAWGGRDGSLTPIGAPPNSYATLDVSFDGLQALVTVQRANDDIWMLDTERGSVVPFLSLEGNENGGVWSHDGRRIAYGSDRAGSFDLYVTSADGHAPGEPLVVDDATKFPYGFTSDDSRLLYTRTDPRTAGDLWLVPVEGDRRPEPFLVTEADEKNPDFSPDGRWVAYVSNDTGVYEVYVRPYPGPGSPVRISEEGGAWPRWSVDGRTLYYRDRDSLLAATVEPGARLRVGTPRHVLTVSGKRFIYDTHPDGRFLMALSEGTAQRSHEVRLVRDALKR